MTVMSPPLRYTRVAMAFHWVLAVVILGSLLFGVYMVDLPFSPGRIKQYNWHKWAGITILGLSVARLAWRWWSPPPPLPASTAFWQRKVAHATHVAMYVLFLAAPLAGWAYSSAAGFPVVYLGWFPLPNLVPVDPELASVLKWTHRVLTYSLAALILLHVTAALKHHWIHRDGLLSRMKPF